MILSLSRFFHKNNGVYCQYKINRIRENKDCAVIIIIMRGACLVLMRAFFHVLIGDIKMAVYTRACTRGGLCNKI